MSIPDISILTLSGNLRLVHRHEASEVAYLGVSINAGSRDDPKGYEGLAHFVEHVLFKGTKRRKSWHIINRMESCGGELNAYTTKENTVVYTVYPHGNFLRAADLLADLLCHSVFPERELAREREVVADEISQYRDIPSEAVFDDFEERIFAGSSLAHNILGSAKSLPLFTSEICTDYLRTNFTAERMVVFYSGPLILSKVVKGIERFFSELPHENTPLRRLAPMAVTPFNSTISTGNHQDNTLMGARICPMDSPDRWSYALLSNILGGPGMNSLLNVELRERRGLVYAVDSTTSLLTDSGLFSVYFGCDSEDTTKCRKITKRVLERIADHGFTPRFLDAAKRQYMGQLMLSSDSRENSVMSMARAVLYYGSVLPRSEVAERIGAVSDSTLRHAAESILNPGLSVLTLR